MNFDRYPFRVSEHLLPALINDDYSGLDDSEDERLTDFVDHIRTNYGLGHFDYNPDDEPHFSRCEVIDLYSNCMDIVYCTPRK